MKLIRDERIIVLELNELEIAEIVNWGQNSIDRIHTNEGDDLLRELTSIRDR